METCYVGRVAAFDNLPEHDPLETIEPVWMFLPKLRNELSQQRPQRRQPVFAPSETLLHLAQNREDRLSFEPFSEFRKFVAASRG
jgi:hypothetical protein